MDEVSRRSSTLSFASCDSGQPSSFEQGYDNTKLQLHAFLEWILSVRWTNRTREHNMADDLFCVYETNPFSKITDSSRQPRVCSCVQNDEDHLVPGFFYLDVSDFLVDNIQPTGPYLFLDFESADTILCRLISHPWTNSDLGLLHFLGTCFSKLNNSLPRGPAKLWTSLTESEPTLTLKLAALKESIVNWAVLPFDCPDLEGLASSRIEENTQALLKLLYNGQLALFNEVIDRVADKDQLFNQLIQTTYDSLSGRRLCNLKPQEVLAVQILAKNRNFADVLVHHACFLADSRDWNFAGWHMMINSFLGRLLRPTPLDHTLTNDEDQRTFKSVLQQHFSHTLSKPLSPNCEEIIKDSWDKTIQQSVVILKDLFRHGGEIRRRTLTWFAKVLEGNHSTSTLAFREIESRNSGQGTSLYGIIGISTPGFALNVATVLMALCEPISIKKVCDIRVLYPYKCKFEASLLGKSIKNESSFIDGEEILARAADILASESNLETKFTTHIFWLAVKSLVYGVNPHLTILERKVRNIAEGYQSGTATKDEYLIGETLCWSCTLGAKVFVSSISHMTELVCAMLLRSAHLYDSKGNLFTGSQAPELNAYGTPLEIDLNLSEEVPPQFGLLPSTYISDSLVAIRKFIFLGGCKLLNTPGTRDTLMRIENTFLMESRGELLAAVLIFVLIDEHKFIRNPSLKMEVGVLSIFAALNNPKFHNTLDSTTYFKKYLARAFINAFVEAQRMGYYERIQLRLVLNQVLQQYLPRKDFVDAIIKFSVDSPEVKLHCAEIDDQGYEKFLHHFASNTSMMLEDALRYLSEIKVRERNPTDELPAAPDEASLPHRVADDEAEIPQQLQGVHNVTLMPFDQLVRHCISLMDEGSMSIAVLKSLADFSGDFIKQSDILRVQIVRSSDKFKATQILYLNCCIHSLVGPQCLQIKVSSFETYHFRPREFLAQLCQIYIKLADSEEGFRLIAATIINEIRYYNPKTFAKAVHIARREGILDRTSLERFTTLVQECAKLFNQANEQNDTGEEVPDEFLDPIMSEIMTDPVRLPTSGVVVDRKVIETHLMTAEIDPFNREPLKKIDLIPEPELKIKILAFLDRRNVDK